MNPKEWLENFLNSRELTEPSGDPLWSYRVTDLEFEDLESNVMPAVFNGSGGDSATINRLFLLYAAEAWKRRYEGGHWTWDIVFQTLGFAGKGHQFNQAYARDRVRSGYRGWKLGQVSGTGGKTYIGAVYAQAGIPEKILEAGSHYYLEQFLIECIQRALQLGSKEDVELIVENRRDRLADSINHDQFVYLLRVLIESIFDLIEDFGLTAAEEPIAHLDSQSPDWRELLPITVSGDAINDLLTRLVRSGASFIPDRDFIFDRMYLRTGSPEWEIYSSVDITKVANRSRFAAWSGVSEENLASIYHLDGIAAGKTYRLASFFKSGRVQGHFEVAVKGAHKRFGLAAFDAIEYQLIDENRNVVKEGYFFEDLPRTFDVPFGFEKRANKDHVFVSRGRITTNKATVLVLSNGELRPHGNSQTERLGFISVLGAQVYQVSGVGSVFHFDDEFRVRTGIDEEAIDFRPIEFARLPFLDQSSPIIGDVQLDQTDEAFVTEWSGSASGGEGRIKVFYASGLEVKDLIWSKKVVYFPGEPRAELSSSNGLVELVLRDFHFSKLYVRDGGNELTTNMQSLLGTTRCSIPLPETKPPVLDLIGLLPDGNLWTAKFSSHVEGLSAVYGNRKVTKVSLSELNSVDIFFASSSEETQRVNIFRFIDIQVAGSPIRINLPKVEMEVSIRERGRVPTKDVGPYVEKLGRMLPSTKKSVHLVVGEEKLAQDDYLKIDISIPDFHLSVKGDCDTESAVRLAITDNKTLANEEIAISFNLTAYGSDVQSEFVLDSSNNWSTSIEVNVPTFVVPQMMSHASPRLIFSRNDHEPNIGPFGQSFRSLDGCLSQEAIVAIETSDPAFYRDVKLIYKITRSQPAYVSNEWKNLISYEHVPVGLLTMLSIDNDSDTNLEAEFQRFWVFAEEAGLNWSTVPLNRWLAGFSLSRAWIIADGIKGLSDEITRNILPVFEERFLDTLAARGPYFSEISAWLRFNVDRFQSDSATQSWLTTLQRKHIWAESFFSSLSALFDAGLPTTKFFTRKIQERVVSHLSADVDNLMDDWKEKVRYANNISTRRERFLLLELPVIVGLSNSDAFPELLCQQPDLKPYVDWAISVMRSEQQKWVDEAMLYGLRLGMQINAIKTGKQ